MKKTIKINKKRYNYKLFDTNELLQLIKYEDHFIKLFTDTIKIYRGEASFIIMDLIDEYINSPLDSITKYSVIYKKNVIISTCRLIYNKKRGYFNLVYTNPEYRGQQICQNHIKHLIYLNKGIKIYELHVLKNNLSAIKCYENIGFKKIKEATHNDYLMRLEN
jgi:ribosomal protein S18 acetylase RimI-like enzyme